ncbi:hypothetical protein [Micromonospora sp. 15K316]|nr:hypothetical protein [Micromonospora sp. 15K316]
MEHRPERFAPSGGAVVEEVRGKLNVTIPAVITYRSYLTAEYAAMPR